MIIDDSVLFESEKINLTLRGLYLSKGYSMFRMSKFEEYDLYADNKNFLVSDHVLTFTDLNGKLMALKPDVTLSIIKNTPDNPDKTTRICYNENVYRAGNNGNSFSEIMQVGVESIGLVNEKEIASTILLAADSLERISPSSFVTVSSLDLIEKAVGEIKSKISIPWLYGNIEKKNRGEISAEYSNGSDLLVKTLKIHGSIDETLPDLDILYANCEEYARFRRVLEELNSSKLKNKICVDFSVVDDINYYNGIVFKGFANGIPTQVLSGGQYDRLMHRMGRKSAAIGFAVYTNAFATSNSKDPTSDDYLNVALPKGRLGEVIYSLFAGAGYECPSILEKNRKLIFENSKKKVRYFWVKPSDVAIYVERGAADIGVAGKDILLEYSPDIYELYDTGKGVCSMAVAAPKGYKEDKTKTLRVATKFPEIAVDYYLSKGRDIDIIKLNGSIEIAPLLGLSDVIVDIVETGSTLRENNLEVIEKFMPISARLIANKSSYMFKSSQIDKLVSSLSENGEKND